MKSASLLGLVVIASLASACSKSAPEEKSSTTTEGSSAPPLQQMTAPTMPNAMPTQGTTQAMQTAPANGGAEVTWTAPSSWTVVPNASQMRKATYKIPRVSGDAADGEMSVIVASGGVDENVKRWAGQFGGATPKSETRTPNGLKVTFVEMKGTYAGGMPGMGATGGPKDHMMLLGAIVDLGDQQWFFKATGPEKTMSASRGDFDQFVASFKKK